jgi:hypothetical protein
MKNRSRHTDLLCELETPLLIRGIQIGEISELGWLIGLVKHATWADCLYFLYLLLISISKILTSSGRWKKSKNSVFLSVIVITL